MGVVYANKSCVVAWSQGESPLSEGDVWDDQAALVVERPDLFDTEPTLVYGRQVVADVDPAEATPDPAPAARPAKRTRR